jgi:NAD(P)-dependent dehydrogenase (short-subunit alcohol dehydrogenase family)
MITKGKTILITGSTDGVGRYIAERLAAKGWRIIVHGRDQTRGDAVVERITQQGARRVSSPPTSPRSPKSDLLPTP